MTADFYIKMGDTYPPITTRLLTEDGTPIPDGSVQSVRFLFKRIGPRGQLIEHLSEDAEKVAGEDGTYRYEWKEGDTDIAGRYVAEWQVTYADLVTRTFPTNRFNSVAIVEGLG